MKLTSFKLSFKKGGVKMKIGLKLCSVLMVLPLVMGVQKQKSDSLYTDLTIGAGGGSYGNTFYTRVYTPGSGTGCDGGSSAGSNYTYHEHRKEIGYKDGGIGLETTVSKKVKVGLRAGYVKDTRVKISESEYTLESKSSYFINPHLSFEWSYFGFGGGPVVALNDGLYYPSFNSNLYEKYDFHGENWSKTLLPSFHMRLGNPQYLYASVSHLENIPLISGGGYLNYGIGTEAIPYLSLWAGYGDKKPFEQGSFLVKGGLKLSRSLSLNFAYRSGKSAGYYAYEPIKEKGFSLRLNYRFLR
jgi:hypothetical protein